MAVCDGEKRETGRPSVVVVAVVDLLWSISKR